jgi:hypothetical protein
MRGPHEHFQSTRSAATPGPAGITALRRKVIASSQKAAVQHAIVRDVPGLGLDALQDFASGKTSLKPEIVQALARELFNARLNDDGLLQSLNAPKAKPMCASGYPPFIDPKSHPYYVPPRDRNAPLMAPQPVVPVPIKPKGPRPGWAA